MDEAMGERECGACGARAPIGAGEAVWPAGQACPSCGARAPVAEGVPMLAPALADTVAGFDPASFQRLADFEAGHFWFEPRNRLLGALVQRHAPAARRVLEIGCGTGFVLAELARRLPAARLTGAELHPAGLRIARQRLGARADFAQLDARRIPARAAFDVIGAFDVLEHIADDEAALGAIRAALRPGGAAVIAVPQHPWLWSGADEVAHHARRYARGELEAKLGRAGFAIACTGSYCALPLPLMVASRWLERRRRRAGAAPRASELEARPGALLNAALRATLGAEVALTLAGLRFPLGGSRVVVARRA